MTTNQCPRSDVRSRQERGGSWMVLPLQQHLQASSDMPGFRKLSERKGSPREARSEGPKVLLQLNNQLLEFSTDVGL